MGLSAPRTTIVHARAHGLPPVGFLAHRAGCGAGRISRRGFTLLEVALVIALLLILSALAIPNFVGQLQREELPGSGRQFLSLISLVRSNAAFDGLRYRIRFPEEDEEDAMGGFRQPLIEREADPIEKPDEFVLVTAPWAVGKTFLGVVRCAEVWLGRPSIEDIRRRRESSAEDVEKKIQEKEEQLEPERPPLYVEPDGTTEWATFVLTTAPREVAVEEVENHPRINVILEGPTGLGWLQRPFYDEELDLFEEKNWPAVLRQDLLDARVLTENDVLELRDLPTSSSRSTKEAATTEGRP